MFYLSQAVTSILVGGAISVVLFIPIVFFQFRKYGQFSPSRMFWLIFGLVYLTGVITYTIFPLPDLTPAWCAANPRPFDWDPLAYFRDMYHALRGQPWEVWLRSSWMMQMVLNVLMLVPLGILMRQLYGVGVFGTTVLGLVMSLTIEFSQYTGNWGLAECAYRVPSINDLMTNTAGAFIGAVFALLIPRFTADADYLERHRDQARPVGRMRRFAGMGFDFLYLVILLSGSFAVIVVGSALLKNPADAELFERIVIITTWVILSAAILLPSLLGNGASLGQRTVYLRPVAGARWQLLLRTLSVQGIAAATLIFNALPAWPGYLVITLEVIWVLFNPSGFSCAVSGCNMRDSRELTSL